MRKIYFLIVLTLFSLVLVSCTSFTKQSTQHPTQKAPQEQVEQQKEIEQPKQQSLTNKECGDGVCGRKETYAICPKECVETCGDGIVQDNENWKNCRHDLLYTCGNGVCEKWEHYQYCSEDCEACIIDEFNQYDGENECPPNPRWVK